jgi:hypothetical protein
MLKKKQISATDEKSRELEKELSRIDTVMTKTASQLAKEAEKSESPEDDSKVENKISRILESLTHEMMQLTGRFHRKKDIAAMKRFLDSEHDMIQSSMTKDDEIEKRQSLNNRIVELHKMMADERHRIKRVERKESLKFVITVSIALVSLTISIYALMLR